MSITTMTKQCVHCKRIYTYNPSVGDFGTMCKHCNKSQTVIPSSAPSTGKPGIPN